MECLIWRRHGPFHVSATRQGRWCHCATPHLPLKFRDPARSKQPMKESHCGLHEYFLFAPKCHAPLDATKWYYLDCDPKVTGRTLWLWMDEDLQKFIRKVPPHFNKSIPTPTRQRWLAQIIHLHLEGPCTHTPPPLEAPHTSKVHIKYSMDQSQVECGDLVN